MPKKPRMSNVRTLGGDAAAWRGASLVSVEQLEPAAMDLLFATADAMKADVRSPAGGSDALRGKVLGNVFYEPSTRTNCSFQAAMLRLGGTTIAVNESTSSVAKGETLSDTVRSLESYCDALVLRHPTKGSAREAAEAMRKPLLNAGDGVGEHPTQALLDVFTIRSELASGAGAEGTALAALAGRSIISHQLLWICQSISKNGGGCSRARRRGNPGLRRAACLHRRGHGRGLGAGHVPRS